MNDKLVYNPRPNYGEWIVGVEYNYLNKGFSYSCSNCKRQSSTRSNYCPNCGANMSRPRILKGETK